MESSTTGLVQRETNAHLLVHFLILEIAIVHHAAVRKVLSSSVLVHSRARIERCGVDVDCGTVWPAVHHNLAPCLLWPSLHPENVLTIHLHIIQLHLHRVIVRDVVSSAWPMAQPSQRHPPCPQPRCTQPPPMHPLTAS